MKTKANLNNVDAAHPFRVVAHGPLHDISWHVMHPDGHELPKIFFSAASADEYAQLRKKIWEAQ